MRKQWDGSDAKHDGSPDIKQMSRPHRRALITGATGGTGKAFAEAVPVATGLLLARQNAEALSQIVQDRWRPGRRMVRPAGNRAMDPGRDAVAAAAEDFAVHLLMCNARRGPSAISWMPRRLRCAALSR
ncbi:hypothetical protein GCM10011504_50110 [Siccirubricoccus deserti]|nr:hypothetical protein GCM10011504_50110 [Siccirubricoccus deserti]